MIPSSVKRNVAIASPFLSTVISSESAVNASARDDYKKTAAGKYQTAENYFIMCTT